MSLAIPDGFGKICIRGLTGMNPKSQGPAEEGCGGRRYTQSFKKIENKRCKELGP